MPSPLRKHFKTHTTPGMLDEVDEERERLEHAWSIGEADITRDKVLGSGASGTVYEGTWG